MGMAASQARFLGLTARKNNVEYEGQQINQQRTALSNTSASYYTDLLGMSVPICPAVEDYTQTIYSFNDGALTNTITSLTAQNDGSYNVSYLSSYTNDFAIVAGGSTSIVKDTNNGYMVGGQTLKVLSEELKWAYVIREGSYTYRLNEKGDNYTYTDADGVTKTFYKLTDPMIRMILPPEPQRNDFGVADLADDYSRTVCYGSVISTTDPKVKACHIEHNLAYLVWNNSDSNTITSSSGITITRTGTNESLAGGSNLTDADALAKSKRLQDTLKDEFPVSYQQIIDIYIDALIAAAYPTPYEWVNNSNKKGDSFTVTGDTTPKDVNEIYNAWNKFWTEDIKNLGQADYEAAHEAWQKDYDEYAGKYVDENGTQLYTFTERKMYYDGNDEYLKSLSSDQLEKLYAEEVTYRDMLSEKYGKPETGWYVRYVKNTSTNNWEPIFYNGDDIADGFKDDTLSVRTTVDTYKIGSDKVNNEIKGKTAYMEQDSTGRYINITFVEEDGSQKTYALTTSTIKDDKAYDDAMNQYEYDKALYDRSIQEINAKIKIIQVEDKDLELRLKQLDTEQDAISNELDAVSKVIQKNVESSFKTFG